MCELPPFYHTYGEQGGLIPHRFPSVLDQPLPLQESRNLVVDNRHMLQPQLPNPRKRQCPEHSPQVDRALQPLSKREKPSHPNRGSPPPAEFWDNLSKVWLTKRALRELDRRNTRPAPKPPNSLYRRPHRPATRRILTEPSKSRQPTESTTNFLCHCAPKCLKDIKLSARHGGPDLSDLRGVRITSHVLVSELTILSSAQGPLNLLVPQ